MRFPAILALCAAQALVTAPAAAEGEPAGDFDYYVLSLSWSPTWCALEGDARGSPECDLGLGWVLHGLWPQYEDGWPSYCHTRAADPTRADTAAMEDIMGSSGLAWYEWQKHGRCSGLTSDAYFAAARQAYASVRLPEIFRLLDHAVTLPASVVEDAFLEANPGWSGDMLTVTCKSGRIQEARLCLTRDLDPRRCGADVLRDCTMRDALLDPIE
jgi:ribonuclease T2